MRASELSLTLLLAVCAGAACTGDEPKDDTGIAPPDPSGAIPLDDENNYTFDGQLDGPSFELAELTDVTVDWSLLDHDLQCHELDPVDDIDNAALVVFPYLSEEEVELGLAEDSLEGSDMGVYLSYEPGDATDFNLSDLTFFGTEANIQTEFTEGSGAWMIVLTTGTAVNAGSRMLAFLHPKTASTETVAMVSDGCSVLTYEADLTSLTPVAALAAGPWLLDWSGLESTGIDTTFDPLKIDQLMLAWFSALTPEELEAQFVDIELLADRIWRMEHEAGTEDDLANLVEDADGSAFAGFQADGGTWLLALRCTTCPNPAPPFLTRIVPFAD